MNCKVCGKEVPENTDYCENCEKNMVSKPKKVFKVTIPVDDCFEIKEETSEEEKEELQSFEEGEEKEVSSEKQDSFEKEEASEKKAFEDGEEALFENEESEILLAEAQRELEEEKKRKAEERAASLKKQKIEKKQKKLTIWMRTLVCFCLCVMVALMVVSVSTDVFNSQGKDNTVVLSSFSEEEKEEFKVFIEKYSSLFEDGYDSALSVSTQFIEKMKPSCEDGLYGGLFGKEKVINDVADPAGRFVLSDGTYSYCKVSEKRIAKILESLNLAVLNDANCKNHYYYNGYYYFRAEESEKAAEYSVSISDSKKTADGHYYVTCSLGEEKAIYVLADKNEKEEFSLLKISHEPLYSTMGSQNEVTVEDGLSYENKRKVIEIKTSDGILFARYVVVYPTFKTEGKTETLIESLYEEKISSLEAQAEKADKLYKNYLKKGGLKENLPVYKNMTVCVTYNENGFFSTVERTASCDHLEHGDVSEAVAFPEVTFEGYAFEIQSGEFVKKDDVLGKDYLSVQQALYRIYSGYSQEEAVTDTELIGEAIYSSAWSLEKDGVSFSYQDENGVYEKVLLPYNMLQGSLKYKKN